MLARDSVERVLERLHRGYPQTDAWSRKFATFLAKQKVERITASIEAQAAFLEDLMLLFAQAHLRAPSGGSDLSSSVDTIAGEMVARTGEFQIREQYQSPPRETLAALRAGIYYGLISSHMNSLSAVATPGPVLWPWETAA